MADVSDEAGACAGLFVWRLYTSRTTRLHGSVNPYAIDDSEGQLAIFVVSYDLRQPGRSYQPLYDRLAAWKAVRGLESLWFINWETTAATIRDDLKKTIDANDGLLVGRLAGETAWHNMQGTSGQTLKGWIEGK